MSPETGLLGKRTKYQQKDVAQFAVDLSLVKGTQGAQEVNQEFQENLGAHMVVSGGGEEQPAQGRKAGGRPEAGQDKIPGGEGGRDGAGLADILIY